jgi:hypothetical protein
MRLQPKWQQMQQKCCDAAGSHVRLLLCMCQHGQGGMELQAWGQQQQQPQLLAGLVQAAAGVRLLVVVAAAAAVAVLLLAAGVAVQHVAGLVRSATLCCWTLHRCFQQSVAEQQQQQLAALGRIRLQGPLLLLLLMARRECRLATQQQQQAAQPAGLVQAASTAAGRLLACRQVQQEWEQRLAVQRCWLVCVSGKQLRQQQQAGASWVRRRHCSSKAAAVLLLLLLQVQLAQEVPSLEPAAAPQMPAPLGHLREAVVPLAMHSAVPNVAQMQQRRCQRRSCSSSRLQEVAQTLICCCRTSGMCSGSQICRCSRSSCARWQGWHRRQQQQQQQLRVQAGAEGRVRHQLPARCGCYVMMGSEGV